MALPENVGSPLCSPLWAPGQPLEIQPSFCQCQMPPGTRAGRAYTARTGSREQPFLAQVCMKWEVAETAPRPKKTLLRAGVWQVKTALGASEDPRGEWARMGMSLKTEDSFINSFTQQRFADWLLFHVLGIQLGASPTGLDHPGACSLEDWVRTRECKDGLKVRMALF